MSFNLSDSERSPSSMENADSTASIDPMTDCDSTNSFDSKKRAPPCLLPCKVCGDHGTGFHYGVTACVACKGFFQRSFSRVQPYKCLTGTGKCLLGCQCGRRRACPKCRLEKCYAMGMSKNAIKIGRYSYEKKTQDAIEILKLKKATDSDDTEKGANLDFLTTSPQLHPKNEQNTSVVTVPGISELYDEKPSYDFVTLDMSKDPNGLYCTKNIDTRTFVGTRNRLSVKNKFENTLPPHNGPTIPPNGELHHAFEGNTHEYTESCNVPESDFNILPQEYESQVESCSSYSTQGFGEMPSLPYRNAQLPPMSLSKIPGNVKIALKRKLALNKGSTHDSCNNLDAVDGNNHAGGMCSQGTHNDQAKKSTDQKLESCNTQTEFLFAMNPMQPFIASDFPLTQCAVTLNRSQKNGAQETTTCEEKPFQQYKRLTHDLMETKGNGELLFPLCSRGDSVQESDAASKHEADFHGHSQDDKRFLHNSDSNDFLINPDPTSTFVENLQNSNYMYTSTTEGQNGVVSDEEHESLSQAPLHFGPKMRGILQDKLNIIQADLRKVEQLKAELKELASCKTISLELFLLKPFIEKAAGVKLDFSALCGTSTDTKGQESTAAEPESETQVLNVEEEPLSWCEYTRDDLESTISTVLTSHDITIGKDLNAFSESEIARKREDFQKIVNIKAAIFGNRSLCDLSLYFAVRDTVGLDIDQRQQYVQSIAPMYEVFIHKAVRFVKRIPGFKYLPNEDKMLLAKESLTFCYILGNFRGMDIKTSLYIDQCNVARNLQEFVGLHECVNGLLARFETITDQLKSLELGYEAIILLKAITSTSPEYGPLKEVDKLKEINRKLLCCLFFHLTLHYPDAERTYRSILSWVEETIALKRKWKNQMIQTYVMRLIMNAEAPLFVEVVASKIVE